MLLSAAEFAALEAGIMQRARLLEAVLADLYGPQSLLAEGLLPAELVFANPGFLRSCRRDGVMPSTPMRHAIVASARLSTPLITSGPCHRLRNGGSSTTVVIAVRLHG